MQLAAILCAFLHRMPEQYRAFSAALERDIRPFGAVQRERMATVLSRRAAPAIRTLGVCGTCRLNTYAGCFAHLHAGAAVPAPPPPGATVVDLVREVIVQNDKLFKRRARAKALKQAALARRAAAPPPAQKRARADRVFL